MESETDTKAGKQLSLNLRMLEAVKLNQFEEVKELVEEGADVQFDYNEPIRNAAASNHIKIANYLLSSGADMFDAPPRDSSGMKYLNAFEWAERLPIKDVFLNYIRKQKLKALENV